VSEFAGEASADDLVEDGEQILHVSLAEREAQAEPHSMLDDNRWKAVAAV
jgi:hypothetical protein